MNKDLCNNKACFNYGRYARYCSHFNGQAKPLPTIKKESKKREEINRKEYAPKARKFVKDHPICQAGLEGCTVQAKCVHHKKGKNSKEDLLNEKFWLSVCFNCHRIIEDNPAFAKANNLSISRYAKSKV